MKRIIVIALAIIALLAMTVPAMAYDTSVTIGSSGTNPIMKCKWEQEPNNNIYDANDVNLNRNNVNHLESGDTPHTIYPDPWSQFLPPGIYGAMKLIQYYAVVENLNNGSIGNVFALVFHPIGSPAPYGTYNGTVPSPGARGVDGSLTNLFKYKVSYNMVGNGQSGNPNYNATVIDTFNAALAAHLISFSGSFNGTEVLDELQQGLANLWMGTALIDYEQPAGNYTVDAYAQSNAGALSAVLTNRFCYVPQAGIEVDFTGVNFGNIGLNQEVSVGGDQTWNNAPVMVTSTTPVPGKSTVRNIGNTWAHVKIQETDMAFGATGQQPLYGTEYRSYGDGTTPPTMPLAGHGSTTWNVFYDAQMGFSSLYKVYFTPNYNTASSALNTPVILPNFLGLSTQDKLDLSILVIEGAGTHTGTLVLGAAVQPFSSGTPSGVPSD